MATIQTTQLEERETGDIKQLRDHDIAEGPVSTNSADATSLKSVPLTLEDGSIIKVRFDSLVTAIGQALGASEDSTVTKVLGLNGTVPKGIGMANLASVLGGALYFITLHVKLEAPGDYLDKIRFIKCTRGIAGISDEYCDLLCYYRTQLASYYDKANSKVVIKKRMFYDGTTWSSWQDV